jgi:hypothetical protein
VARLFELPPEEFTQARDRLARELREEGDADAAAGVRKLKRPSMAAWALNLLVRRHRDEVEELIAAGERLREAQRSVLQGSAREALREASSDRRRLTDALVDRAGELLTEAGHSPSRTHLDRVERTLQAASLSEDAAEELRRGMLERELEPPEGFEALGVWDVPEAAPLAPRKARAERRDAEAREAEERAAAAEAEAERLSREVERLERETSEARRAAKRAAAAAERARRRAADLRAKAGG